MEPRVVGAILDRVATLWTPANDVEITLEANPTSVEADRFRGFATAGVNRFSLGLQALDDADLRALGRLHSAEEGLRAYETARATVPRVSFDLIYARQHQTPAAWEAELARALSLGPDHLSLYQLTIEPGTPFAARDARGRLPGLPDEDRAVAMWEITQTRTRKAGLRRYETSNHATSGAEARHNMIYWRGGDWLGVGPGAHGRLTFGGRRVGTVAPRMPHAWLKRSETGVSSLFEPIPRHETVEEYVLMGLRLADGISLARWRDLGGRPDLAPIEELVEEGLVDCDEDRLHTTERGALLLNRIALELLVAETA
jgi:oxygen-independent coproporphyrinogen-3 oxidase